MRVYELTKKLGMENRALIPELKRLGISVASHSSALDDEAVQKALDKLMPQGQTDGTDVKPDGKVDAGRKALKKGSLSGRDHLGGRDLKSLGAASDARDSVKAS